MKVFGCAVLVALLFVIGISADETEDLCGDNTELQFCGPRRSCENICGSSGMMCTMECNEGCYCKRGYIREYANGPCILESECPASPESDSPWWWFSNLY